MQPPERDNTSLTPLHLKDNSIVPHPNFLSLCTHLQLVIIPSQPYCFLIEFRKNYSNFSSLNHLRSRQFS